MISAFRLAHTVWGRQPVDTDCVISIEYFAKLLNHVSKNWEVLAGQQYTDYKKSENSSYWYILLMHGLPNLLTRDLATLKNTLSISHSPQPLAAGPIRIA